MAKIPLGQPLQIDAATLDKLAQPTQADILRVLALWKKKARKKFRRLLDAKLVK